MSKNKVYAAKHHETAVGSDKKVMEVLWDCGSPLYDSHELASLSHLIERHLMILPSLGGSKRFKSHHHHNQYQHQQIDHIHHESTVVVASMKSSEAKGEYMVLGKLVGCMGISNYSFWSKMRGGRTMKIKFKKFRPLGIKWFM